MDILGKATIFRNERGYSTSLSNTNQEGQKEYMGITVQLPKDTELENKTKIDIKKGFLSFYKTKEGLPKVKAVIQEYDLIDNGTFGDNLPF